MNVQQNALRLFNVGWCRLRKKLLLILSDLVLRKKNDIGIYFYNYHTLSQISKVYETINVLMNLLNCATAVLSLIVISYGPSKENTRKMT